MVNLLRDYQSFNLGGGGVITCNLNTQKHDYLCKLNRKTFHFYACYYTFIVFLSFHAI